jgi:hypothetical protein
MDMQLYSRRVLINAAVFCTKMFLAGFLEEFF